MVDATEERLCGFCYANERDTGFLFEGTRALVCAACVMRLARDARALAGRSLIGVPPLVSAGSFIELMSGLTTQGVSDIAEPSAEFDAVAERNSAELKGGR